MAPYRIDLFEELGKYVNLTVCFEQYTDDTRDDSWYKREHSNFTAIINTEGKRKFFNDKIKIELKKPYDFVIFYEFSTLISIKSILYCQKIEQPYLINCDGAFIKKTNIIKYQLKKELIKRATGLLANGASAVHYFLHYGAKSDRIFLHSFSSLLRKNIINYDTKGENYEVSLVKKNPIFKTLDGKICLAVGRFIESKNFDYLINIWGKIPVDISLIIVGNGKCETEYRNLITERGLSNVYIVNHLNKKDLFLLYRRSELLLFPVENEVWGLVIEEAMSQGVPVISTVESNAAVELINSGENGYIVSKDFSNDWIRYITEICTNQDLKDYLSGNAINSVKNRNIEHNAEQIYNILTKLSKD